MRKSIYLSALALAFVCVGCGGNGTGSSLIEGPAVEAERTTVPVDGTATEAAAPAEGTTQSMTVNVDGQPTEVEVPGGENIAPGEEVVVIPDEFPLDVEESVDEPDNDDFPAEDRGTNSGKVYINGKYTGIKVKFGKLVGSQGLSRFGLKKRTGATLDIVVKGPLQMGSGSKKLSIRNGIKIHFTRFTKSSYPTRVSYRLPANGKYLSTSHAEVWFNHNTENARGTLTVTSNNWTKKQTSEVHDDEDGAVLRFSNMFVGKNDKVPSTGVRSVVLNVKTTAE